VALPQRWRAGASPRSNEKLSRAISFCVVSALLRISSTHFSAPLLRYVTPEDIEQLKERGNLRADCVPSGFAGKNNVQEWVLAPFWACRTTRIRGVAIGASCRIVSAVSLSHAGVSHLCSLATAPASPTIRRACSPKLSTERCLASRTVGTPASGRRISAAFRLRCSASRRRNPADQLYRCSEAAASRGSARTR
jgi:hypothetical protein